MEELNIKIAKELQALSDVSLQNLGDQSFFIVNAYYESEFDNVYIYDAEIINIGEFIKNNFKIGETKKEKLVLNKRGAVLGFFRGYEKAFGKTMYWVENYTSYLGNPINSNFQYSTDMLPKEEILIDTKDVRPIVVFETLIPKKDYFGEDVIEDGKTVYKLSEYKVMSLKEVKKHKQKLVSIANITGEIDERTYYMVEYVNKKLYSKLNNNNDKYFS